MFLLLIVLAICFCLCQTAMSVSCSLVVTCWERVLESLVCDIFLCFITFPYGVLGQVWYLIVLIPDLCPLSYFYIQLSFEKITRN